MQPREDRLINQIPTTEELLQDPEYFRCEKLRIVMRKAVCVEYQGREKAPLRAFYGGPTKRKPDSCEGCKQGEEVKKVMEDEERRSQICPECRTHPGKEKYGGFCGYCANRKDKPPPPAEDNSTSGEGSQQPVEEPTAVTGAEINPYSIGDSLLSPKEETQSFACEECIETVNIAPGILKQGNGSTLLILDITPYVKWSLDLLKKAAIDDVRTLEHEAVFLMLDGLRRRSE